MRKLLFCVLLLATEFCMAGQGGTIHTGRIIPPELYDRLDLNFGTRVLVPGFDKKILPLATFETQEGARGIVVQSENGDVLTLIESDRNELSD